MTVPPPSPRASYPLKAPPPGLGTGGGTRTYAADAQVDYLSGNAYQYATAAGTSANGVFASDTSAAAITDIAFYSGPAVSVTTSATQPSSYSTQKTSSNSMRFGGPGAC